MARHAQTLLGAVNGDPLTTALIIPATPSTPSITITYSALHTAITSFATSLANLGIGTGAPVSIALGNSLAFVIAFLGAATQRAIAAPLNPGYTQDEFEFYVSD